MRHSKAEVKLNIDPGEGVPVGTADRQPVAASRDGDGC
jgi:hypothetical protein